MANELDINEMGEIDLNDLEDLKGFEPLHDGEHLCTVHWSGKKINDRTNYVLTLKLVETKQLADPTLTPQDAGFDCSTNFNMENETGRGFFKAIMKPLAEALGTTKVTEIIERSNGMEALVLTGHRLDKEDKTRKYLQVKSVTLV